MAKYTKKELKKALDNAEYLRLYAATLLQYEDQPIELRKRQRAMHELAEESVRFISRAVSTLEDLK